MSSTARTSLGCACLMPSYTSLDTKMPAPSLCLRMAVMIVMIIMIVMTVMMIVMMIVMLIVMMIVMLVINDNDNNDEMCGQIEVVIRCDAT